MSEGTAGGAENEQARDFIRRHLGPGDGEISEMLKELELASLEALVDAAVPRAIRSEAPLRLPGPRTEADVLSELRAMAKGNRVQKSMIGLGYHGTITPPVILRNVLENPGWYTAYTPYQPEISQGRLEALLNYQTMITDLTGMEFANASLLDEGTAAAEAMTMCRRVSKASGNGFFVSDRCLPQTVDVVRTRAAPLGIDVVVGDEAADLAAADVFGALLQYPDVTGAIPDYTAIIAGIHARDALAVVAADLLSLVLLKPPGEFGADVVVGNSQRFGVPLGFGGPHAAFLATREDYRRTVPGRIVGQSVDARGRPAHRLALQTREQHIRREKATSNICTAQVLLAVIAGMYAVWHGPDGLRAIAGRVHGYASILAEGLRELGLAVRNETFFDTLSVSAPGRAEAIVKRAREGGVNLRPIDADTVGISVDETTSRGDVGTVLGAFAGDGGPAADLDALARRARSGVPEACARTSPFLGHEVFHRYRSETEMLRYLARLQAKDIALDRSMIPLGSCTMKLNATAEMLPVTWPEFADIHPFAPLDQAAGYLEMIRGLQDMLAEISGFDAVSLQPNAGSQGEYAGLWAIRAWHRSRGDEGRDVCLIPSSAHGTNPASAIMAGCEVVVVDCDFRGQHRRRRPRGQGRAAQRPAGRPDGHLPLDPRRVRGTHQGHLRRHPRQRRSGLHGRRQPERHGGDQPAGGARRRRHALQPAQDLLHPPRRRRSRHGPGRRQGAPGAVHAESSPGRGGGSRHGGRRHRGRSLGKRPDPAHLLDLHRAHGGRRSPQGDAGRDPQRQLHGPSPGAAFSGRLSGPRRLRRARMHHRLPHDPARYGDHGRGHRQAADGLRLPRADHVLAGGRRPDDRAHRGANRNSSSTGSATP